MGPSAKTPQPACGMWAYCRGGGRQFACSREVSAMNGGRRPEIDVRGPPWGEIAQEACLRPPGPTERAGRARESEGWWLLHGVGDPVLVRVGARWGCWTAAGALVCAGGAYVACGRPEHPEYGGAMACLGGSACGARAVGARARPADRSGWGCPRGDTPSRGVGWGGGRIPGGRGPWD